MFVHYMRPQPKEHFLMLKLMQADQNSTNAVKKGRLYTYLPNIFPQFSCARVSLLFYLLGGATRSLRPSVIVG